MLPELTLSQKLTRLRGDRQQKEIALGAGLHPTTLCRIERGDRDHSLGAQRVTLGAESLRRLASFFDVLPEYFTGDLRTYMQVWARTALSTSSLSTPGARLRNVLDELQLRFCIRRELVADKLLLSVENLRSLEEDRARFPPAVFEQLTYLVGIPPEWIRSGAACSKPDAASQYQKSLEMALRGGMPPQSLEELIRNWFNDNKRPLPEEV